MNIDNAIGLLKSYNGPFELTLHPGASDALIEKAELAYGIIFPEDFKTLYRFSNGFEIDEDILNMIPLEEMISHGTDKQIWIAEYMIYCDTWELEVNPANPGDYSICIGDYDKGKIRLTNSLAEFIDRMLKGGVFEKSGLYHWQDEIKAKIYGNTDPDEMKPLLAVFSECLKLELISKEEVIRRANWIISTEHEPDPFFARISRSQNSTELIVTLNSIKLPNDILQIRVIFGIVRLQFAMEKMKAETVLSILGKFAGRKEFTPYEANEISYLIKEGKYLPKWWRKRSKVKLNDRMKVFLNMYRDFNPYYYQTWNDINSKIVNELLLKD